MSWELVVAVIIMMGWLFICWGVLVLGCANNCWDLDNIGIALVLLIIGCVLMVVGIALI